MSEESFIDKVKFACSVIAIGAGLIAIILLIDTCEIYVKGKENPLIVETIICVVISVISGAISFFLGRKNKKSDALTLKDWLEFLGILILPQSSTYDINQFGEAASESKIWRKLGKGISIRNLLVLLLFIGLTLITGFCSYDIWHYKNGSLGILPWSDPETYVVSLLGHVLICILLIGYIILFSMKIKKNGSSVLEYIVENQLDFNEINQDFSESTYCGGAIWVGKCFLYVRQMNSSIIIPIQEIISVTHNRAFGKLYYFLRIETVNNAVIKYYIDMAPYFHLQNELQKRDDFLRKNN